MSSGAKKRGVRGKHTLMKSLPLGKKNLLSITNNPTQFPFDWHNSFQHNEELGPVPISVWLPFRMSTLQTPPQGRQLRKNCPEKSWRRKGRGREQSLPGLELVPLGHCPETESSILKGLGRGSLLTGRATETRAECQLLSFPWSLVSQAGMHDQNLQSVYKFHLNLFFSNLPLFCCSCSSLFPVLT